LDIELFKTFLEVKKTGHFGQAAENLYLTQAAVSARIKQLENTLGQPIFRRYRNNLQLTLAGERLVKHAETILVAWEMARSDISLKKNQKQIIGLGATSGLWDLFFQEAINHIHKSLPQLALRAESHSQEVLVRRLLNRTLDFVLVYEPAKITDIVSTQVAQVELILVSTKIKDRVEEILNEAYVSVDWGTAFEISFTHFFPETSPPILHTTLAKIALEFILEHGGSAYLPLRLVEPYLGEQLVQIEEAPAIKRPVFCCYHRDNENSRLLEQLLTLVRQICDDNFEDFN
jgi:DNA-binding transcriptional LysR family regulator